MHELVRKFLMQLEDFLKYRSQVLLLYIDNHCRLYMSKRLKHNKIWSLIPDEVLVLVLVLVLEIHNWMLK